MLRDSRSVDVFPSSKVNSIALEFTEWDALYPFQQSSPTPTLNPVRNFVRSSTFYEAQPSLIIKQYYFAHMTRVYQRAHKKIPNPIELLQSIKNKEKACAALEKELASLKQSSNLHSNTESKSTLPSLSVSKNILRQAQQQNGTIQRSKAAKKLTQALKQLQISKDELIKFSLIESDEMIDAFLSVVNKKFKDLNTKIACSQKQRKFNEQKDKKMLEEKFRLEMEGARKREQKMRVKLESTQTELMGLTQEKRRLEKENTEMHQQIYKTHLLIVEKSHEIQQLRQKLDADADRGNLSISKSYQFSSYLAIQLEILKQNNDSLSRQLKAAEIENKNLRSQISQLVQKQDLNRRQSQSSLNTLRSDRTEINRYKNEVLSLREEIRVAGIRNKMLEMEKNRTKEESNSSEREKMQKFIQQWKEYLDKTVRQYENQLQAKDEEIRKLKAI